MQKRVKIESSFFAERFIGASTTKNNIPEKNVTFGDIKQRKPLV